MRDQLVLMGTGDALGVPRVYCECEVCQEARSTGANRRMRCSALLRGGGSDLLIDCGPDWRLQMERIGLRHVERVLITHGHHDHIAGLPDLWDAVRWTGRPVEVMAPAPALAEIQARFPWAVGGLNLVDLTAGASLLGWQVQAWEVNHGRNGRSFAFRFDRPGFAWAYCPDAIDLSPAQRAPLAGLDLLVLGTAYYEETAPRERRSLYSMVEALDLLAEVRPGRTVFTHLSHGVDSRSRYPLPDGVTVGHDGMVIQLGQ
ncbi:MAG: MBL fold metallo-hydrolase [Bacillota bacterium]